MDGTILSQEAFIVGRKILDLVLSANEVVEEMQKEGSSGC